MMLRIFAVGLFLIFASIVGFLLVIGLAYEAVKLGIYPRVIRRGNFHGETT